ncbi:MAG: pseudouridine synthase [Clostridia bacterium]
MQRIDKIIASQGEFSRKEVKKLIKLGKVKIDGKIVKNGEEKCDPNTSEIALNGKTISFKKHIYLMLNKPKGVVSATKDKKVKTVVDLVPPNLYREGIFPAGRLDGDTTGFILLTDDGDFAHDILSPKKHIMKTYIATLTDEISNEDIEHFKRGVELKDGTLCLEAVLEKLNETTVQVQIHEGKYHQIKRMFAAIGNHVLELKRVKMGELGLDLTLAEGECRELTAEELALVKFK